MLRCNLFIHFAIIIHITGLLVSSTLSGKDVDISGKDVKQSLHPKCFGGMLRMTLKTAVRVGDDFMCKQVNLFFEKHCV